jgi:hypothetical protein
VCKDCTQESKINSLKNVILDFNREIQELKQGKTHEYLGTEKSEGI